MDFESATSKEQCVWPFAGVSRGRCLRDLRIRRNSWTVLFASLATLIAAAPVFAQTAIARPAQALQYVAAEGSDANDGLTRQAPKSSISAAYDALPPCHSGHYWAHCGRIRLGAGTYVISSPIVVKSPQVSIRGAGQGVTILEFTGTSGCAIEWTGHQNGAWRTGGLFDLAIDGSKAGPQACGLRTYDMGGFNAREVEIMNFAGAHGIGWDDAVIDQFNERDNVSMTLFNNTTGWKVEGGVGRSGYSHPYTTFGYGNFDLWINTSASGQVGIHLNNYASMEFSDLHIIENMVPRTTGIEVTNHSDVSHNLLNIHMEGGSTAISVDNTSAYHYNIGELDLSSTLQNRFTSPANVGNIFNGFFYGKNGVFNIDSHIDEYPRSGNDGLLIGLPSDADGTSAALMFALPNQSGVWPLCSARAGRRLFCIDSSGNWEKWTGSAFAAATFPRTSGTLALQGANGISAGTLSLTGGNASHTFKTPYTSAPVCTATDETSPSPVQVQSGTTGVTVQGLDGDKIAWICTPQTN